MTNGEHERDLLAAEYVLGTLEPEERERVAAEMAHDRDLRLAVAYWEERLGRLGLLLPPVRPPRHVWRRIAARAGLGAQRRTRVWQGLALAASVAAIALAGLLVLGVPVQERSQPPAYASLIHDEPTGAGWLLTADAGDERLTVTAIQSYPRPADKSLHLWLLPEEGGPVSLGLLPDEGAQRMPMPEGAGRMLDEGARFAVSLEPPGGSPEPQPTGEVLWVAPVAARSG